MDFTKLVPNIFYVDIRDGIKLFVDCLQFKIVHNELNSERPFCVIEKNGLRINIFQNFEGNNASSLGCKGICHNG